MTDPKEPEPFDAAFWKEIEGKPCICHNTGWYFIDDWHECAVHFEGQLHPQSRDLLLDSPLELAETERTSVLNWKIAKTKTQISTLSSEMKQAQSKLLSLELELINKTPTIKLEAIKLPDCF